MNLKKSDTDGKRNFRGSHEKKLFRSPKCAKCRNHGIISCLKGHKKLCSWKECQCSSCQLVMRKQKLMASQVAFRRRQKHYSQKSSFRFANKVSLEKRTFPKPRRNAQEDTTEREPFRNSQKKLTLCRRHLNSQDGFFIRKILTEKNFHPRTSLSSSSTEISHACSSEFSQLFDLNLNGYFGSEIYRKYPSLSSDVFMKSITHMTLHNVKDQQSSKLSFSIEALLGQTN